MIHKFFNILTICFLFFGSIFAQKIKTTTPQIIKIGLLISNSKSIAARNGAEIAIEKANKENKAKDLQFQLIVKSMEGSWGTGSKEAVNLIFNDNVYAIISSSDGRNAHLVEQVIAKTHIVFISAWASDPTLSQAFVPWYFSIVPNNKQQANALIEEIYKKRKFNIVVAISDDSYDSKLALQSFLNEAKKAGKEEPIHYLYKNLTTSTFQKIKEKSVNCFVLFGKSSLSTKIIQQLHQNSINQPIFGTLSLLKEDYSRDANLINYDDIAIVTSGNWLKYKHLPFQIAFQKKYGKIPGAEASYAYDGINIIIKAIIKAGFDRDKIQEYLSQTHYEGITGSIQFDKNGNRMGAAELIKITNGIPDTDKK